MILGSIMSILDTTIVNVALETLGRDLHSTLAQIQWVITGYMLSLAAVIPLTGWAARRFGAKRVYIALARPLHGGSALCGLASSTTQLILFRVLQGVGGGMILPVGQMMMADAAGPKRMGRVMGIIAIPAMLAPILGPTLGGLIVDNASWRWIFFVNVPIGVIALVAALRILPRVRARAGRAPRRPRPRSCWRPGCRWSPTAWPRSARPAASPRRGPRPDRRRARAHRRLRPPRPARPAPAARPAPLPASHLRVGLDRDVLPRRGAVRRDDPDAALLAADPRRERRRHRPPDRAEGPRDGARHAARRPPRPTASAAARWRSSASIVTTLATIPFGLIGAHTSIASALSVAMFVRGIGIGFAFMPAMAAAFASLDAPSSPTRRRR